jgi:hypothetical protein
VPILLGKLGELLGSIGSWLINTALPDLLSNLAQWGQSFVSWVQPQIPPLLTALGNFMGSILGWVTGKAVPEIGRKVMDIGRSIVDGIKQGISGAWQAFLDWIRAKVMELPEPVRQALGISSPARVMMPIGENVVAGMEVGMDQAMPGLFSTAENMARGVAQAASDVTARIGAEGLPLDRKAGLNPANGLPIGGTGLGGTLTIVLQDERTILRPDRQSERLALQTRLETRQAAI